MVKIYDSWDSAYKSRFGALPAGTACAFSVRLPKNIPHDLPPVMVVFRTGFKERYIMLNEEASGDDYIEYRGEYTPKNTGLHQYYFMLVNGMRRAYIKRQGPNLGVLGEGELFQLTVYDKAFSTPDFIKGGILYQIFPDRFCKSGKPHPNVPEDRVLREDWDGTPYYRPDEQGRVRNNDYFGGDLEGITGKLDYLKGLGVTCIYLNPVFESHENHRYSTADYRKIDPLLGTNEDFRRLCEKAGGMGIAVVLDGVFSHTGADSVYFNKNGRYGVQGAYFTKSSEFYPWYSFSSWPEQYDAWWGFPTLPNVNENRPEYTAFICGEGGVIDYWLSLGASGWRLDVADELPDEFLDRLRRSVKKNGPEKFLLGEVWEDASNKVSYGAQRRYLLGDQLDSTMNYPFRDAIIGYILGMNAHEFENRILTILENYPKPAVDTLMNMLSTHDIERAVTVLGGPSADGKDRDWQAAQRLSPAEYELGKKRLKCAMVLQFFLPGVPSIYYGDEAGLQGYKDPFNRRCYPWGGADEELTDFVRRLAKIRRRCDLFRDGEMKFLFSDADMVAFTRFRHEEKRAVIVVLNKGAAPRSLRSDSEIIRRFKLYEIVRGSLVNGTLELPPYDYAVARMEM